MGLIWVQIFWGVNFRGWATPGLKNFGHWTRSREHVVPYSSKNPQNRDFWLKCFFFHKKIEVLVQNHEKFEKNIFFSSFKLVFKECF